MSNNLKVDFFQYLVRLELSYQAFSIVTTYMILECIQLTLNAIPEPCM